MKLVIDLTTGTVAGGTTDPNFKPSSEQLMMDSPAEFIMEQSADWFFDGEALTQDPTAAISRAIIIKIAEIKEEAERRITALDWRLQRAKERDLLGEVGMETELDVLELREQIRQQSNAAEIIMASLATLEEITAFTW